MGVGGSMSRRTHPATKTLLTRVNQVRYTLREQSGLTSRHYLMTFVFQIVHLLDLRPNGNTCSVLSQDDIWPSSSTLKQ